MDQPEKPADYEYYRDERLGMLCGTDEPDWIQVELAEQWAKEYASTVR